MVKPSGQAETDAKQRIFDAADEIFVRRGIDGARMQEIADHAGVNKALLHYYFRSKANLARGVWLPSPRHSFRAFEMMASDMSLDDKIDRFVDAYHTMLTRHPYLLAYVISEAARHPELVEGFYSSERRQAARRMIDKVGSRSTTSSKGEDSSLIGRAVLNHAGRQLPIPFRRASDDRHGSWARRHRGAEGHPAPTSRTCWRLKRALHP